MRLRVLLVLLCQFLFFSCKKYKPADAAFFIRAENVTVAPTSAQGSGSNKITDLWLYVNGQFQGAYPVGNLMPIVPKNNVAKINIFGGIKNNGIAGTRIPWLVYERYDFDTTVAETGKTVVRNFAFKYSPYATFVLNESFDQEGYKIIKSPISISNFSIAPASDCFEGKSLLLTTSTPNSIAQIESAASYTLPSGNSNLYLELNYKCNAGFSVGLITTEGIQRSIIYLKPQYTWNKIYISLADAASQSPISTYKIYFAMPCATDVDVSKMFLDNIKIVYI